MKLLTREQLGIEDREAGAVQWDESALLGVTIHHFAIPRHAATAAGSRRIWLGVDNTHEQGEYNDIAYNFGFDDFDQVMEGRGWDWMTGANGTTFANTHYMSFVYMGHSGLDKFSDVAQKNMGTMLKRAFDKGVGRVVVTHHKWTGTGCPGDKAMKWVNSGAWKADLPRPKRVQYLLVDDAKVIDKSAIVPLTEDAKRLDLFLNSDAQQIMRKHMMAEGTTGNVQIVRKVLN